MLNKINIVKNQRGSLLIEALIAITIIVTIVTLGSQMIVASLRSEKFSNEKNVALGFIEETFEAVEAVSMEKWQNIYKPPSGSGDASLSKGLSNHYYAYESGGKWLFASGDKQIVINGLTYTVFFTIDNTSRDLITKNVESSYSPSRDDPSTQKIIVTVSWTGGLESLVLSQYFSRWRNDICGQTDWNGSQSSATTTCPTTTYGSDDGNLEKVGGSLKLNSL